MSSNPTITLPFDAPDWVIQIWHEEGFDVVFDMGKLWKDRPKSNILMCIDRSSSISDQDMKSFLDEIDKLTK